MAAYQRKLVVFIWKPPRLLGNNSFGKCRHTEYFEYQGVEGHTSHFSRIFHQFWKEKFDRKQGEQQIQCLNRLGCRWTNQKFCDSSWRTHDFSTFHEGSIENHTNIRFDYSVSIPVMPWNHSNPHSLFSGWNNLYISIYAPVNKHKIFALICFIICFLP